MAALRGYVYQVYATGLQWLRLRNDAELHLEVAEDFVVAAQDSLRAVQVKDRADALTLASATAKAAIESLFDLTARNPSRQVHLAVLTTAPMGKEKKKEDRPDGIAGLRRWAEVAAGADPADLRRVLLGLGLSATTTAYLGSCSGEEFRERVVRRLEWQCGAKPLDGLREEFEAEVGWACADEFRLPASEASRVAPHLVVRILETSCAVGERLLRREDLRLAVEQATRVSLPFWQVERLIGGQLEASDTTSERASTPDLSVPEGDFQLPGGVIDRVASVTAIQAALGQGDIALVYGGSGMGKTVLARLATRATGLAWRILDLRGLTQEAACGRLVASAMAAPSTMDGLIADDLPDLDLPGMAAQVGRALHALRGHGRLLILTSARAPGAGRFALGVRSDALVEALPLTLAEVASIARASGGGPAWAELLFHASQGGHPQLAHALARGLEERGWPEGEANLPALRASKEVIDIGRAVRRSLVAAVPALDARKLLHRLSLVDDRFPRRVALAIDGIASQDGVPGERFDFLVGPWIDQVGEDRFRVSPLLLGPETLLVLPQAEQLAVHRAIAESLIESGDLEPDQAQNIFLHALRGGLAPALRGLATATLQLGRRELRALQGQLQALVLSPADPALFPQDPETSLMLRFSQFELARSVSVGPATANAARGLLNEARRDSPRKRVGALVKVFLTQGMSAHLPEWPTLLAELADAEADTEIGELFAEVPQGAPLLPTLFGSAVLDLPGTEALVDAFRRLAGIPADARSAMMLPRTSVAAPQHLVARAWLRDQEAARLEPGLAVERYREMAELALGWGQRDWAAGLRVAIVHLLAEPGRDVAAALAEVDVAIGQLGEEPRLLRARCHVKYVLGQDEAVVATVARLSGALRDDPIDRAHMLREGAVSLGRLGRHAQSSALFRQALDISAGLDWPGVAPLVAGLRGDVAIAEWRSGDRRRSLGTFAETLDGLAGLDPGTSLQAAYVHRVVRHALLWLLDAAGEQDIMVDGAPPVLPPGSCSNPNPPSAIVEIQLAPLGLAWYLLAQVAALAGMPGEVPEPASRLNGPPIVPLEAILRKRRLDFALAKGGLKAFPAALGTWLDAVTALEGFGPEIQMAEPNDLPRGEILRGSAPLGATSAAYRAWQAVLAFGICAGATGCAIPEQLLSMLIDERIAPPGVPGSAWGALFGARRASAGPWSLAECVAAMSSVTLDVERLLEVTLRVVIHVNGSDFRRACAPALAQWAKRRWKQAATEQRFALRAPGATAPVILDAASAEGERLADVAALALAALAAVRLKVEPDLVEGLRQIASAQDRAGGP